MIYILLPAFNEYPNIKVMLKDISKEVFLKNKTTIVLVNDGSFDETYKLKNYKNKNYKLIYLQHKKNRGLNMALKTGLMHINKIGNQKDVIITLDSDNTHPIIFIKKLVQKLQKNNDVSIASRFVTGSKIKGLSLRRKFLSYCAKLLFKCLLPIENVNDYTCNFRAYKFKPLKNMLKNNKYLFESKGFGIAAELLIKLNFSSKNIRFEEIPFTLLYNKKIGNSKIKLASTIFLTIKLILTNLFVKYSKN